MGGRNTSTSQSTSNRSINLGGNFSDNANVKVGNMVSGDNNHLMNLVMPVADGPFVIDQKLYVGVLPVMTGPF